MSDLNCHLDGTESRFLIQLMTGQHVAIQGPAIAYAAKLLRKLNDLHINQPLDRNNEELIQQELRILTSIQSAEMFE